MANVILLNVESSELRYARLRNGVLIDLNVERQKSRQITGNIYRGLVTNILPNIKSAFIDFSEGENGFIHMPDIIENAKKFEQRFDMSFDFEAKSTKAQKKMPQNIEELLQPKQPVLVQVIKEPIGSKGARLTSNISIAGRYLVLLPNSPHRGVSRKIEDAAQRDRLKKLIRAFEMPHDMGLICRTASAHASADMLIDEAHDLLATWQKTMEKFHKSTKPTLLYEESDLIKRALMNCIDYKYDRLIIDDYATYQKCKRDYKRFSQEHPLQIEYYRDKVPMFERFNVEKEIEKATRSKIWLPSGSYLFFDHTEAMYTIDVNSGRNPKAVGNVEETLVAINLEAADEIARQLRLRNIGGLVIIDFIDMNKNKSQRQVLSRLKERMKEDPAKSTILSMSDFCLVEMTRQRSRESLLQTLFTHCPYCRGSGLIKSHKSMAIEIERALKKVVGCQEQFGLKLVVHPELNRFMKNEGDQSALLKMAKKLQAKIEFDSSDELHLNDFQFYSTVSNQLIEI